MTTPWQDVRYGLRRLGRSPGFTAVAVLSLALGIGANTAVFSAINAVLLRSLPVRNPHELRLINWVGLNPQMKSYTGIGMSGVPGGLEMGTSFPYPAYRDFRDRGTGFTSLFAFRPKKITAVTRGEASAAVAMLVSDNYFSGYGVAPLIGRSITADDDRPGAEPVAMITYRWWERYFGLDPNVLGELITVNQIGYTIVGVLPRQYVGPMMGDTSDIYVPMAAQPHLEPSRPLDSPNRWWVQIMGRLSPDASDAQARASLAVLFRRVLGESNSTMDQPGIRLEDGSRGQLLIRRQLTKPFLAMACVVALVLLVACANLAGLLLVRGAVRRHEMAVRAALGAGRWRLIRMSLIESFALSSIGAGLGLVVAGWMKHAMGRFLAILPEGFRVDLRIDSNVLLFTLAVSILTAIVFGCLPAILASRVDPAAGLKNRAALGTPRLAIGKVLVAGQVSLCVLLVVGAGLMIRSFANLASVAPGFDPANVLLFQIRPEDAGYAGPQCVELYDRIRTTVAAIPGVRGVTFSSLALISNTTSSEDIEFLGRAGDTGQRHRSDHLCVGDDFFRTMNIPLLLGRDFTAGDTAESQPVGIVNEAFVRRFLTGENALGQTFLVHDGSGRRIEIVGVCRDAKYSDMRADVPPIMYLPQRQRALGSVCFEVRSVVPPLALVPAVRKAVATLDTQLPLSRIRTQEQQVEQSLTADRLFAALGGAFALLAVLLSCIGLYGLVAYNAARRTREIGLRMALGATRGNVAGSIVCEALRLVLFGLGVGMPAALVLARLIKSQLYGVEPNDPFTVAAAVAVLVCVAMIAAWIPARRAARVDPMAALRQD